MDYTEESNGKKISIAEGGDIYIRYAVKTHFIKPGEDYIDIIKKYVSGIYMNGDIVSISEKIIAICQERLVRREDIKIGVLARFLSRFACRKNRGGYGVGMPINMQYAINKVGRSRVLLASLLGGFCKLFGIKGVFYRIVGREVAGLDGFYDGAWEEYRDVGIEIPNDPCGVCREIREKLGISCMIVDANDFGQVILGKSDDIELDERTLTAIIRDNPAGQGKQCTPLILIRKVEK